MTLDEIDMIKKHATLLIIRGAVVAAFNVVKIQELCRLARIGLQLEANQAEQRKRFGAWQTTDDIKEK